MDELEISGKRYISTRRAAKEHKYHSDYIGQLIRAGKVEGQKVGRSWYVVADSLSEYLAKETPAKTPISRIPTRVTEAIIEEKETPEQEVEEEVEVEVEAIPPQEEIVEVASQPVQEKAEHHITLKINKPIETRAEKYAAAPAIRSTRTPLRYVADDEPLYPRLQVQVMPRTPKKVIEELQEPEEQEFITEQKANTFIERPIIKKNKIKTAIGRGSLVLAAGAVTFGLVAAMSAFVASTTTIQGETASAGYSIEGL